MVLSKRLKTIADMVEDGTPIYDVGCDHGYLDIYLAEVGHECTAIDVRPFVIKTTKQNVAKSGMGDKIEVLLNDGLENLVIKDNSTIILSGLGAKTILKIIDNRVLNKIIVQSNDNLYLLRKTMKERNYYIVDEEIIFEDNKYYVIIKFEPGSANYTEQQLLLGPILLEKQSEIFINYLIEMNKHFSSVLLDIPESYSKRKDEIKTIIKHIKTALK